MIKKGLIAAIIMGTGMASIAQTNIQQVAKEIVSNNLSVQAAGIENQIRVLEDREELIPGDPEIVGAYSWGSPSFIGNKKNLNAHQKFKFPTFYARQRKMNSLSADLYENQLDMEVNRVLYESLDIMLDLACLKEKKAVLNERLARLTQIKLLAVKLFEEGETNRIELEKASLLVDTYQQDLLMIDSEQKVNTRRLSSLNAGNDLEILNARYEDFEKLFADRRRIEALVDNPVAEAAGINKSIAGAGVEMAKTSYLPDWQFGYIHEAIRDENLAGVQFGLSLPLWGKPNKLKKARLHEDLADNHMVLTNLYLQSDWDNLNETARQSFEIKNNLESSLKSMKSKDLLKQLWKLGEISLLDYLLELPFYYEVEDRVIEAEKQYYKAILARNRNHLKGIVLN